MDHKQGTNRMQMFMFCLESTIDKDASVRVVDAFVDAIDLKSFGFSHVDCLEEGRPPYHPSILLKLYLYGYRYGIRTSRKLEREAQTNMEACGCWKDYVRSIKPLLISEKIILRLFGKYLEGLYAY